MSYWVLQSYTPKFTSSHKEHLPITLKSDDPTKHVNNSEKRVKQSSFSTPSAMTQQFPSDSADWLSSFLYNFCLYAYPSKCLTNGNPSRFAYSSSSVNNCRNCSCTGLSFIHASVMSIACSGSTIGSPKIVTSLFDASKVIQIERLFSLLPCTTHARTVFVFSTNKSKNVCVLFGLRMFSSSI